MKTGLIVFGHGSSIASANTAVRKVAKSVAKAGGFKLVETAFLDPVRPTLAEAAERLVRRGAERIVVLPYFLTLGLHLQRDLPVLIKGIRTAHPGVLVLVGSPLDEHPGLTEILLDRVRTTLACEGRQDKRKRT
jgi:sirohydrochlorin ferrochelatase